MRLSREIIFRHAHEKVADWGVCIPRNMVNMVNVVIVAVSYPLNPTGAVSSDGWKQNC